MFSLRKGKSGLGLSSDSILKVKHKDFLLYNLQEWDLGRSEEKQLARVCMDGPDCPHGQAPAWWARANWTSYWLTSSLSKAKQKGKNISCKCQGGTEKPAWYSLGYVIQGPSLLTAAWRHCGILTKFLVWSGETRLTKNPSQTYYTHTHARTFSSAL